MIMLIGSLLPLFAKSKGLKTKEEFLKAKMFSKDDVVYTGKGNNGSSYTQYYTTSLYNDENKNAGMSLYKYNGNGYNYEIQYWNYNRTDSVYKRRSVLVKNKYLHRTRYGV